MSLHIQSTQQRATEHKTQPQMYSAAVFLCVVYRVTSGFTVTASHNLRKSASRQLLERKPFVVVDREKNIGIIKAKY